MSKKKNKKKDEWEVFVCNLLSRRRKNRPYKIPTTYITAIADRIHSTNPTKDILINTLTEFYSTIFDNCYKRFLSDLNFRKDQQERDFERDWKKFQQEVDDRIHTKPDK